VTSERGPVENLGFRILAALGEWFRYDAAVLLVYPLWSQEVGPATTTNKENR